MSEKATQTLVGRPPWVFQTSEGEVSITSDICRESWPCQGHKLRSSAGNTGGSVEIWRFIKDFPELEQTHPELWNHFKIYDKISLGNKF